MKQNLLYRLLLSLCAVMVCQCDSPTRIEKEPSADEISKYRDAASQGDAVGQHMLGRCFLAGIGVQKDTSVAKEWFQKAADQGYAASQVWLGMSYQYGRGIPENGKEAVKWYRKAAEQGYAAGQSRLGSCYSEGVGVQKNDTEAAEWYRKAAEQGDAAGQWSLGDCYGKGEGLQKDHIQALKWYRKAADQDVGFQLVLGHKFRMGMYLPKDEVEAAKCYRKAAEAGHADAQKSLGDCYADGLGLQRDLVAAYMWYNLSAAKETLHAQEYREKIAKEMTPDQILDAQRMSREWKPKVH